MFNRKQKQEIKELNVLLYQLRDEVFWLRASVKTLAARLGYVREAGSPVVWKTEQEVSVEKALTDKVKKYEERLRKVRATLEEKL